MNGFIESHPKGTFEWAMEHVRAGRDVRRKSWPIEVAKAGTVMPGGCGSTYNLGHDYIAIWRVYKTGDAFIEEHFYNGWNSLVIEVDDREEIGHLGMSGEWYRPSGEDKDADEWQLVSEVTSEDIAWHDANRLPHHENPERIRAREYEQSRRYVIWACVGVLMFVALFTWAAFR